jgi:hypothetical protein
MSAAQRPTPPAPDAADRLPHDRAVWRDHDGGDHLPQGVARFHHVGAEYEDGRIFETLAGMVDWPRVKRWRFGWAPEAKHIPEGEG